MSQESIKLYEELITRCKDIVEFTEKSKTYPTQFSITDLNKDCYNKIYEGLKKIIPRKELFPLIKGLSEECSKCWRFYLSPRNRSIRILDLQLGKKFEYKLMEFLESKGFDCRKGDIQNKKYPDNVIYNGELKVAYLEVKYQSAPWIFAFKEQDTNRECYEGSPALDIKKLEQQYELIKNGEIDVPIYYVYWLDFPCISGIFFISAKEMYEFYKNKAKLFDRKEREGDFKIIQGKKIKVSATKKIHPSIFSMGNFEQLLRALR